MRFSQPRLMQGLKLTNLEIGFMVVLERRVPEEIPPGRIGDIDLLCSDGFTYCQYTTFNIQLGQIWPIDSSVHDES